MSASDLPRRLGTAAVALPLLWAVFFLAHPAAGLALIAAALLVGLLEFFALLEARRMAPYRAAGLVMAAAFFIDVAAPRPVPLAPLAALVALAAALAGAKDRERSIPAAAATLMGAAYLGALGGTMAALHVMPPASRGPWRILLLLVAVMASDSLAYFTGRALGRRKLAPAVSPGKTVEGAIGGVVGGVVGALAVGLLGPPIPPVHAALLGAGVAVFGMVGDLAESLLKRWAGVKDAGRLFPGHGGMLDRLDSLLFAAPVLYYYFALVH